MGFTNGVAVVILASQAPRLFGCPSEGSETRARLRDFALNVGDSHAPTAALERVDELRAELAAQDVRPGVARVRRSIGRSFREAWLRERAAIAPGMVFTTLNGAMRAYEKAMAARS